ncbi:hypothetical protein [Methylobacterium nigriterrae]|uniref:hypothetical protein n=1 Tax=Methylobacterium nigriterrae TaxID=3127512 RepID=UPI003013996D
MQDQTALSSELAATDVRERRLAEKLGFAVLIGGAGAVTLGWVWLLGWSGVRLVAYLIG